MRQNLTILLDSSLNIFGIAFIDIFSRFSYQYLGWLSYVLRPLGKNDDSIRVLYYYTRHDYIISLCITLKPDIYFTKLIVYRNTNTTL